MGLITETNAQYYAGQQAFTKTTGFNVTWTGDTDLIIPSSTSNSNFSLTKNGTTLAYNTDYTALGNVITLKVALITSDVLVIQLNITSIWDNYGSYAYTSLTDIVNNFMIAYVGLDKIIPRASRSDVIFHAKRGLQELVMTL